MDLSIIIVTWNSAKELKRCLESVFTQSGISSELFVIDNGSTDDTRKILSETKGATVILNDSNRGFAAAVNQGIAQAKGEYLLLLNPDTELTTGALASMLTYLRANHDVGVAGGKVLNEDGLLQPSVRHFPTVADQSVILLKLHRLFPKLISKYLSDGFDYSRGQEVDQVRGAYFFILRNALNKIGPFDEKSFFIWFEEVDYCKRVKDAGLKVVYFPDSVCRHVGGASFKQALSVQKQRWMNRSMLNYFKKHGSSASYLILAALTPISFALAALSSIVPQRFKKYV